MNTKPCIFFNGTARAAIAGHVKVFNSPEPEIMTMGSVPHDGMDISADRLDWVMHCKLAIGDGSIMISDDYTGNNPDMAGNRRAGRAVKEDIGLGVHDGSFLL